MAFLSIHGPLESLKYLRLSSRKEYSPRHVHETRRLTPPAIRLWTNHLKEMGREAFGIKAATLDD
jgi:hypothetical protein